MFRHSIDASTAPPTPPPQVTKQLRQNSVQALDARRTAADHTYDHASRKWESFDADSVPVDQSDYDVGPADQKECKPASQLAGSDRVISSSPSERARTYALNVNKPEIFKYWFAVLKQYCLCRSRQQA